MNANWIIVLLAADEYEHDVVLEYTAEYEARDALEEILKTTSRKVKMGRVEWTVDLS